MRYLLLVSLLCLGAKVHAQGTSSAASTPVMLYDKAIGNQSHLYNGVGFQALPIYKSEHPFFLDAEPTFGSLIYHGQLYDHVLMQYDLVHDQIQSEDAATGNEIQLVQGGISSFHLLGHHYVLINNDKSLEPGFYDLIYDGTTRVVVRRQKMLQHKRHNNVMEPWYQIKNKIYIGVADKFVLIRSKKNLWSYFPVQRDQLKKQMRQKGLRFGENRELYCGEVAKLYETILK